jgi:hypothetical protein
MDSLSWNIFVATVCSYFIFLVAQGTNRLLYHPLRGFPGPKLAALTLWYKAYYDIIQDGMWSEHIEELHRIYGKHLDLFVTSPLFKLVSTSGSVVRIAPNEVYMLVPGIMVVQRHIFSFISVTRARMLRSTRLAPSSPRILPYINVLQPTIPCLV